MKKSTRILTILLACMMFFSSFSVLGSAYQAYKDDAITNGLGYDDVDAANFTLEQYASMGLDEVDRMLAKEQISLNIYIGTLDMSSISGTIASVENLLESVSTLLPLLGDAQDLSIASLEGKRRNETTDLEIIHSVFDFLADNAEIFEKYVNGTISLGIMNSFIESFIFDVRELVLGIGYSLISTGEVDFDAVLDGSLAIPDEYKDSETGAINLVQALINKLVLGEWQKLDEIFDDPYADVSYSFYEFSDKYDETAPDTANYDYYGWVHPNQWVLVGLGGAVRVNEGEAAPAAVYDAVDVTTNKNGYDFIENLLQRAYNYILVPVLQRDTVPWLRRLCGVEYEDKYRNETIYDEATGEWIKNPDYDPNYTGIVPDELTDYAKLFNINATVEKVTIPAGETLVDNFNDILGDFLDNVLIVPRGTANVDGFTWNWIEGGNDKLLTNVASVAKFVIQTAGDLFFADTFDMPSADEINDYTDQQVGALILRAILNSSVDYIYVSAEYQTLADVGYAAVEQLAWQDIPQFTYTKPARADYTSDNDYYAAVVDKMLDILFDIAIYNLNQGMDMVPANGADPKNAAGLLQYQGDGGNYETTIIQVAAWAISEYGPLLALDFNCDDDNGGVNGVTIDDVWTDIDTIINQLIPIKSGNDPWISEDIAGQEHVVKSLLFDNIIASVYTLDSTNLAKLFERNATGAFAKKNGVEIIVDILDNVFDLLFPNVFSNTATTVDAVLQNNTLGTMIHDLFKSLGTKSFTGKTNGVTINGRAEAITTVGLPLVCMLLGLSDDQEFEEMEIQLPGTIKAGENPEFNVFNGSSGINTGYTDASGNFTQDKLYTYAIQNVVVNTYLNGSKVNAGANLTGIKAGDTLNGGTAVKAKLNGNLAEGMIVEVNIVYNVKGETGANITTSALTSTVYAVVGNTDVDDDEITDTIELDDGRVIEFESEMYLDGGDSLGRIENYQIRVRDTKENESVDDPATTGTANITSVSGAAFATKADGIEAAEFKGQGGIYFFAPFAVVEGAERFEYIYPTDENGDIIYNEDGTLPDPIGNNGGYEDGKYTINTVIDVDGTSKTVTTNIHLYDDFGLEGLFNSAVAANRQQANYDMTAEGGIAADKWAAYVDALQNAATLVLTPKSGDNFESRYVATEDGYKNLYEQYAEALSKAIEELEVYAENAGVDGIVNTLKGMSGVNYTVAYTTVDGVQYPYRDEIEYYEDGYVFFGMRDFVPHTYNRYADARDNAWDLINSQQYFINAPFEEGYIPSNEEIAAYNESIVRYNENVANMSPVSAINATYAIHKLNLMHGRLIRLEANTSKLQVVYDMCVTNADINAGGASYYTEESWTAYQNAKTFAAEVLATPITLAGQPNLEPSKVNTAVVELVDAWKHLVQSCDFTGLDTAIAAAKSTAETEDPYTVYTQETFDAFYSKYVEAVNYDRGVAKTDDNQAEIDALTQELIDAQQNLAFAQSAEPVYPMVDPDVARESYLYHTYAYDYTFAPFVDTSFADVYIGTTLPDGTPTSGYILGTGVQMGESDIAAIFPEESRENVTVTVTMTESYGYGTGATLEIFNADGDRIEIYQIVVRGDVNGDGEINGSDKALIIANEGGVVDWCWNSYETYDSYYAVAGDLNGDFSLDGGDAAFCVAIEGGLGDVNQETGEQIYYM